MKSFTDLEQSKKLAEILPIESADMRYHTISQYNLYPCDEIVYTIDFGKPSGKDIPCWSLAALLKILKDYQLFSNGLIVYIDNDSYRTASDNPVDACYEMILKLHELKLL